MPHLALRSAGRRIGSGWVWRQLDLDLQPGDRLAIQGPSGSGKTLLLRALAGLDALDEGSLLMDEAPVEDLPRHRATVALVAQQPALPDGTVRDALKAPFEFGIHAGSYDESAARALVASLRRDASLLDQSTVQLSGGEAETVHLVRTLLLAPTILLLDEPTAGLDPERTEAVERVITDHLAAAPERAVVWTSHDATQIERVTDRQLDLASRP